MRTHLLMVLSLVFYGFTAMAQSASIQGKILNDSLQPVEGATIEIKENGLMTTSNENGIFKFSKISAGSYTIVVSYIGFVTQSLQIKVEEGEDVQVKKIELVPFVQNLREVIISVKSKKPYNDTISSVSMRTETKLIETPQSVQVIPKAVMRDQQANNLNQLMKNAVGVSSTSPFSEFIFRGFTSWNAVMYNGVNGSMLPYNVNAPTYIVDNVEFVRGPSSVLYSSGRPGGMVNMNTKKPLDHFRLEYNGTIGSWNEINNNIDITDALSKNKRLCYRLILGQNNAKSFRNWQSTALYTVSPSLSYVLSAKSKVFLEYHYFYQYQAPGWDAGAIVNMNADSTWQFKEFDPSFSLHSPNDRTIDHGHSVDLTFKHEFNKNIKFTLLNRYFNNYEKAYNHGPSYADPAVVNDTVTRWYNYWDSYWYYYQGNAFNLFKFNTRKIKHQLLVGLDYSITVQPNYFYKGVEANAIDIKHPDYSHDDPSNYNFTWDLPEYYYQYHTQAAYVQEQMEINKYIKISGALRYDSYKFWYHYTYHDYASDSLIHNDGDTITAHAFIPRGGIVINPWKNIAFYYSYSQSFEPQWVNSINKGGPFPPTYGFQNEVGYKGDFFKNKLSTAVSFYKIDYKNVLVGDPTDTTGRRYISVNGMVSKGIESNIQGSINENIDIIVNAAYGEVKYYSEQTNSWKKNDRQLNVPRWIWGAFLSYKFTKTKLKGFGLNAGVHHESNRVASWMNQQFVTPGFTYYDAGINYKIKKFTFYFNANNLLNTKYITGGYVSGLVYPGSPRNFHFSVNYIF
ncbi:MAG: TonB-dependent siderophore receptor [Flavobacteriales bacterium]